MEKSIIIDHLCRVEGSGGVGVNIKDGKATEVKMNVFEGPRFFEAVTVGRYFNELSPILSRICAICTAAHGVVSLMATEDAFSVEVTPQTKLLRDLLIQGGNIESHSLHIFCLALPDFLGYKSAIDMAKDYLPEVAAALRLKKLGNTIQELIGGRAIHFVNIVVGGFGKPPSRDELLDLKEKLEKGLAEAMELIELLATLKMPDFPESPTVYVALEPEDGKYSFFGDKILTSTGEAVDVHDYKKICNETVVPYSHAKQSFFQGKPFMVGALARLSLNEKKLNGKAKEVQKKLGISFPCENIFHNNTAQAVELVYSIERALEIVDQLLEEGIKDEEPVKFEVKAGTGTAAIEAPRGTLYHSYTFDENGRATKVDVITPTAQNYANMEKDIRTSVERLSDESEESLTAKLEMVVRSYDPCISCSVHIVKIVNGNREQSQRKNSEFRILSS